MARARPHLSIKRIAIDKANARMLVAVATATFILTFVMVAGSVLVGQFGYQNRVIGQKRTALIQLDQNITQADELYSSYQEFASSQENVLGGDPGGKGPNDGENPRIVLDALPSKYDFPALASSIEKLLNDNQYQISSIEGIDDEIAQSESEPSGKPTPIEIPFGFTASTNVKQAKNLSQLLERSIRPIQINKMTVTIFEAGSRLAVKYEGKTYFQPEKILRIDNAVVPE